MEKVFFHIIFGVAIFVYINNPHIITSLFVESPLRSMDYIMNQPMGIKQNTVIKTIFGTLFKTILSVDMGLYFTLPIRICSRIIFAAYSYNTMILMDIFNLLQNKTYNPIKKRTDTIHLSVDQIVLSVFLFSFGFIIYTNLVVYYVYFVFLSFVLELLKLAHIGAEAAMCRRSPTAALHSATGSVFSYKTFVKRIFTGELLHRIYK